MSNALKEFSILIKKQPYNDNLIDEFYKLVNSFNGQCIALSYDQNESGNGTCYLKRCRSRSKCGLFCEKHNSPNERECVICKKPGRCVNIIHDHKYECYGTILKPNLEGLNNHEYIDRTLDMCNSLEIYANPIKKVKINNIKNRKIENKMIEYDIFSLSDPNNACSYKIYCKISNLNDSASTNIYNLNKNILGYVTYWKNQNIPDKYKKDGIIYDNKGDPIYIFCITNDIYKKSEKTEYINYIYDQNELIETYDVQKLI